MTQPPASPPPGPPDGPHPPAQAATEALYQSLYAELKRMARSRLRQSGEPTLLNTTALVHEAYLRIDRAGLPGFPTEQAFMAYAARTMRSVVVDMVRARQAQRRGGDQHHTQLDTLAADLHHTGSDEQVLHIHQALQELEQRDPRLAQVVDLRYFGGLTDAEIAACLAVTERTVQRDWQKARLLLSVLLR